MDKYVNHPNNIIRYQTLDDQKYICSVYYDKLNRKNFNMWWYFCDDNIAITSSPPTDREWSYRCTFCDSPFEITHECDKVYAYHPNAGIKWDGKKYNTLKSKEEFLLLNRLHIFNSEQNSKLDK